MSSALIPTIELTEVEERDPSESRTGQHMKSFVQNKMKGGTKFGKRKKILY